MYHHLDHGNYGNPQLFAVKEKGREQESFQLVESPFLHLDAVTVSPAPFPAENHYIFGWRTSAKFRRYLYDDAEFHYLAGDSFPAKSFDNDITYSSQSSNTDGIKRFDENEWLRVGFKTNSFG